MRRAFLALAAALALVGCGGTKTVTTTHTVTAPAAAPAAPAPAAAVPVLDCPPGDLIMQCVLATQPAPSRSFKLGANPKVQYGIDFGWTQFSPAFLRSIGATFAESYLSHDFSKDWQPSNVAALKNAGFGLVDIYETSATRAAGGAINAALDAPYAVKRAASHGNRTGPITFAIDFDATGAQVDGYFRELHRLIPTRDEAYGGYYPLKYLCAHHLVGRENFQTYAWSRGLWLPASCAPNEQYLNGDAYDHDKAIAPLYGQWFPRSAPAPRPTRDRLGVMDRTLRRFPHGVTASEWKVTHRFRRRGCRQPARRSVCVTSTSRLKLFYARILTVAYGKPRAKRWTDHRGIRRKLIYAQLHQR